MPAPTRRIPHTLVLLGTASVRAIRLGLAKRLASEAAEARALELELGLAQGIETGRSAERAPFANLGKREQTRGLTTSFELRVVLSDTAADHPARASI